MYDITIFGYSFLNEKPFLFFCERFGGKILSVFKEKFEVFSFHSFFPMSEKGLKKATEGRD